MNQNNLPQDQFISTGASVRVQDGTIDSISGFGLSGWSGRVLEVFVDGDEEFALVLWDSLTLQAMPAEFIQTCLAEDYNWAEFAVPIQALFLAEPRDSSIDSDWERERLNAKYLWDAAGPTGRRIKAVIEKQEAPGIELLTIWKSHLEQNLVFPFNALLQCDEEDGLLPSGEKCRVTGLAGYDQKLGIVAWIEINGRNFALPLYDIEPARGPSHAMTALKDYQIWWANR